MFNPRNSYILATSDNKGVKLWDLTTNKPRSLPGTAPNLEVEFSPDGRTLATLAPNPTTDTRTSVKNGVQLWDTTTDHVRTTLLDTRSVNDVVFSPDGRTLAANDGNSGPVRLWDVSLPDPREAIQKICRVVHRDLTPQERSRYLPGQSSGPACPS